MFVTVTKDIEITQGNSVLWVYADDEVYYDFSTGVAYHPILNLHFDLARNSFIVWN